MYLSTNSFDSTSIWGAPFYRKRLSNPIHSSPPFLLKGGFKDPIPYDRLDTISNLITCPIFQPYKVASLLAMQGYEPVSPYTASSRNIFDVLMCRPGVDAVYLPGMFGYILGLAKIHGKSSLLAGMGPSLISALIDSYINFTCNEPVDNFLRQDCEFTGMMFLGMKRIFLKSISLFCSYPFIVAGNICILRCIKGESSVWVWSVFREVWQEAGWGGFYSGFFALWLYEVVNIWCQIPLVQLIEQLLLKMGQRSYVGIFSSNLSSLIVTSFTQPLLLTSSIMTANKCSARLNIALPALPPFSSSRACFTHLYRTGIWFRGLPLLRRLVVDSF